MPDDIDESEFDVFLTAYHFEGDRETLVLAADRLLTAYPPSSLSLFLCAVRPGGLTVIDACPSEEVATAFRTSPQFAASLAAAGLPEPRIESLGDVHRSVVNELVDG